MIRITDILDKVTENHPDAELDIIDRAYIFSARVHDGQMRLSGEPYLSHPLEVAGILADMKLDSVSIAAGLLHDVIEDTHATEEEIGEIFGHDVLHIVSGVTKLSKLPFNSAQAREAESIRKMLLAMAASTPPTRAIRRLPLIAAPGSGSSAASLGNGLDSAVEDRQPLGEALADVSDLGAARVLRIACVRGVFLATLSSVL